MYRTKNIPNKLQKTIGFNNVVLDIYNYPKSWFKEELFEGITKLVPIIMQHFSSFTHNKNIEIVLKATHNEYQEHLNYYSNIQKVDIALLQDNTFKISFYLATSKTIFDLSYIEKLEAILQWMYDNIISNNLLSLYVYFNKTASGFYMKKGTFLEQEQSIFEIGIDGIVSLMSGLYENIGINKILKSISYYASQLESQVGDIILNKIQPTLNYQVSYNLKRYVEENKEYLSCTVYFVLKEIKTEFNFMIRCYQQSFPFDFESVIHLLKFNIQDIDANLFEINGVFDSSFTKFYINKESHKQTIIQDLQMLFHSYQKLIEIYKEIYNYNDLLQYLRKHLLYSNELKLRYISLSDIEVKVIPFLNKQLMFIKAFDKLRQSCSALE